MTKRIVADDELYFGDDEEQVDLDIRKSMAEDPDADASLLVKLSHDPSPRVRRAVKFNPSTPKEVADAITDIGPLYAVVSTNCEDSWYWSSGEWKTYVCFDFDNNVVINGNRDYTPIEEAYWWVDAKAIAEAIDNSYGEKETYLDECPSDVSEDKLIYIWDEYSESDTDDNDTIADIAMILYPDLSLETTSIHGSCQGEYVEVVYDTSALSNTDILEDWFFGNVTELGVYEIDYEAMEDDDMEVEDLDAKNIHEYGDSSDFGCSTYADSELWHKPAEEIIAEIASDNGIDPKDCIYLES